MSSTNTRLKHFSFALSLSALLVSSFQALADASPRVMSVDWTQTETMLALGVVPVGVAQGQDYDAWVKSPPLPPQTKDVGLRTQPNIERIYELRPDRIFIAPYFSSMKHRLVDIAPVTIIDLYESGITDWSVLTSFTRRFGEELGREAEAEALIQQYEKRLSLLKQLINKGQPPLLMIQFMDTKHVRVFGQNSLYSQAIEKIGLSNAWNEKTNSWGFSLVGIDKLAGIKAQIVIVEPLPYGGAEQLSQDPFWQYVVQQSGEKVMQVAPVWSFGSMPSALRFAELVTASKVEELTQ
ncbi:iron-siderophore ABC transporter substrate-binding protein [Vibrio alginolyticus]|uniref:iron-siderophore ABC transporter substrate-binding protein n=1 Tax=Vibrio alginolyticus TaxID=663 RepID=UPI00102DA779|nr:iron-siderophore ABC transporter substrate-binding protein [Vibrio alginolyticus]RZV22305.1 iron-siderophore ABC transporter substrate-binding protein [Vibrio alginolyticus]